jgi:hypothetical protein
MVQGRKMREEERLATAGDGGRVKVRKIPRGAVGGMIGESEIATEGM